MADIIGRGFDSYVQKQVIKRQEKLRHGQIDQDVIRFNNANNAFLRLTSGVNVDNSFVKNNLSLDGNIYSGNNLAKYFKLFAAQTYNPTGSSYNFTKGVGYSFQSSYGFSSPDYTSYGLVPPPGITSATIKALNRGSLREATVNIKCHNLQQFQIIEALYLRLKYSILLEWGHSLYFNNDGELINSTHDLSEDFLNGLSQSEILSKIENERSGSYGNYDAFFGLITNFDWTVNPDGGYDINMIARASGDVIESLKINANSPSNISVPLSSSNDSIHLEMDAYKSTLNRLLWTIAQNVNDYGSNRTWANGLDDGTSYFKTDNASLGTYSGITPGYTKTGNNLLTWLEVYAFSFPNLSEGHWNRQYYIKLGALLRIIESFLAYYNPKRSNEPLFKIDYNFEKNYCFTFPRHVSLDPKVCLIPYPTDKGNTKLASGSLFYNEEQITVTKVYFPTSNPRAEGFAKDQTLNLRLASALLPGAQTIDIGGGIYTNILVSKTSSPNPISYTGIKSSDNTTADIYTFKANTPYYLQELRSNDSLKIDNISNTLVRDNVSSNLEHKDATFNEEYITSVTRNISTKVYTTEEETSGAIVKVKEVSISDTRDPNLRNINQSGYSVIYRFDDIFIETTVVTIQKFSNTNSTGVFASNTGTAIYEELEKNSAFKNLGDKSDYTGKLMHMHVNIEYIAKVLSENISKKEGEIKLYNFLEKLMDGIQNALGNVNNFEIIYNESLNTFNIIDNTLIPGQFQKLDAEKKKIVEFVVSSVGEQGTTGGSFIHNVNFRTKLSNNFATMATIGAQANGATVGQDATALSRWNIGLTDRIIQEKISTGPLIEENLDLEKTSPNNINTIQQFINQTNNGRLSDAEIASVRNLAVDMFKAEISAASLKNQKNDGKGGITSIGFIPFDLELTMMGLSGPKIYESYTIDTRLLPKSYQDAIQFICSGVSHTISNGEWKTTLNSICGPKQEGSTIEAMKAGKPATSSGTGGGGGGKVQSANPDEVCGASTNNVNIKYPKSIKFGGSAPVKIQPINSPTVTIQLASQPVVPFSRTTVTQQDYVAAAEQVINQIIPGASKDQKLAVLKSAYATSLSEQRGKNGGFRGFNNNISGVESSGFQVFNASDVNGKVEATEGGTGIKKFYYSFSNLSAGLVPLISKIIERNMFDDGGGANEWAWRSYRDWNGYGARTKPTYVSDCTDVKGREDVYNEAAGYVNTWTTFK